MDLLEQIDNVKERLTDLEYKNMVETLSKMYFEEREKTKPDHKMLTSNQCKRLIEQWLDIFVMQFTRLSRKQLRIALGITEDMIDEAHELFRSIANKLQYLLLYHTDLIYQSSPTISVTCLVIVFREVIKSNYQLIVDSTFPNHDDPYYKAFKKYYSILSDLAYRDPLHMLTCWAASGSEYI